MTRKSKIVNENKTRAINYKAVAESFYNGAFAAAENEYWNAAGVLAVHAAIALADAITIKYEGIRSIGEDHQEVAKLLSSVLPASIEKKTALTQLSKIIAHKNSVSYYGDIYEQKDFEKLLKHLERFKTWADKLLSN